MEIKKGYPPNIELIRAALNPPDHAIYCYGENIYNPSGKELSLDLIFHESVHSKQQGTDPETWWNTYLQDKDFRYSQELQAYGEQYVFLKSENIRGSMLQWALDSMAKALSGETYNFGINHAQALSKIRNYGKE